MPEYRVLWEIDVDADSPREAAEKARAIQKNPASHATVFYVTERGSQSEAVRVDLMEGLNPEDDLPEGQLWDQAANGTLDRLGDDSEYMTLGEIL